MNSQPFAIHAMARRICSVLAFSAFAAVSLIAHGQATGGRASSIVLPVAAKTGSFETEVFVRNPNTFAITVDVLYYEANGLASPGLKTCATLSLPDNSVTSFKLGTQCSGLATGSHFGLLVLRDADDEKIHTFRAYSRVQHVSTNQGFSIEGFPEHTLSGRSSRVIGLKRIAASTPPTTGQPGYQPNCFVGSLGEAVTVQINVFKGADGSLLGILPSPQLTFALAPYQLERILDIYGSVGGVGDQSNISVRFNSTVSDGAGPAYVAFCTEQDNLSFGADFRIATSDDEANLTKLLTRCRGTNNAACTTLPTPATLSIQNGTTKHRFSMFIHHPDYLRCDIVGPNAAKLDIQLVAPGATVGTVGPVVAGGTNQGFLYYETGPRDAVVNASGFQTFWSLDVGPREGGAAPAFPADYGIACHSGSGIHLGGSFASLADDF